jgi:hypothetical protein
MARVVASAAVAVVLVVAGGIVAANAVSTSSARVNASTSTDGLLTAGNVVLRRADDSAVLALDAMDLYPGRSARGCVAFEYAGSVPVDVRLFGDPGEGTGLDEYIDLRLTSVAGATCPSPDQPARAPSTRDESAPELYRGRLSSLWSEHSSYGTGVTIVPSMSAGDRVAIDVVLEVVDDNRAQGLTIDFSFTFEARPA